MNLSILQKSIIATIVYYGVLDYPLTGFEIYKYLVNPARLIFVKNKFSEIEPINKITLKDILFELNSNNLDFYIDQKNGFYFLKGRSHLVEQRIERHKISDLRWKKVIRISKLIQVIPFVKMISICNSLAINNSKESADIDFFVITRQKRIWLVRFLITFAIWLMGEWRHKNKIAGKICLSFYAADNALNLNSIAIAPYDPYLANWIYQIKPIFCENDTYNKFISENNWVFGYLLNYGQMSNVRHPDFKKNWALGFIRKSFEFVLGGWFGNIIEYIFRFFQKIKISKNMVKHEVPTAVVVSDTMLKFHENDKRAFFQKSFQERLEKILH